MEGVEGGEGSPAGRPARLVGNLFSMTRFWSVSCIASVMLLAIPLAVGCGDDSGASESTAATSATAATAISADCSSALENAEQVADGADAGPDPELRAAILSSLDACTADEYIAATNAAFPGVTSGPADFIALCDGNQAAAEANVPAGCAQVATFTEPQWTQACEAQLAAIKDNVPYDPSVCEARQR